MTTPSQQKGEGDCDDTTRPANDIDRTVIRRLLKLTPAERARLAVEEARNLAAFDQRARHGRR